MVVANINHRATMRSILTRAGLPTFKDTASQMYCIVWPNVRAQATKIVKQGFHERSSGWVATQSLIGDAVFPYKVTVAPPFRDLTHDGSTYTQIINEGPFYYSDRDHVPATRWEVEYNVYEPGGSSSGQRTRRNRMFRA